MFCFVIECVFGIRWFIKLFVSKGRKMKIERLKIEQKKERKIKKVEVSEQVWVERRGKNWRQNLQLVVKIFTMASWKLSRGRTETGSGAFQAPSGCEGLSSEVSRATLKFISKPFHALCLPSAVPGADQEKTVPQRHA